LVPFGIRQLPNPAGYIAERGSVSDSIYWFRPFDF